MKENRKEALASNLEGLPGAAIVLKGLADLESNIDSEEALMMLIARPAITRLGFSVPERSKPSTPHEISLYQLIQIRVGAGAYGAYNALSREVVSFCNAYISRQRREQSGAN